jgi:putative FmdB family regulatory protein
MPTYDYECTKCGHVFEAFQSMTDKPLKSCPQCKGKIKRLIGAGAGIIFKGSGFYATDYKRPAKSAKAQADAAVQSCPKQKEGCRGCSKQSE